MKNLMIINNMEKKDTFSSLELVELINKFREEEGNRKELKHYDFMKIIRDEFEEEEHKGNISVKYQTIEIANGAKRQSAYYELTLNQSKQVLLRESKFVRRAVIEYINKLEEQLRNQFYIPQTYAEALKLAYQQAEQIEKLTHDLEEAKETIIYKEDIIVGLVDDVDLATKRQRLNQIIRNTDSKNYGKRWSLLYDEFEKKYHIDLQYRFERDKDNYKPKIKNKMDYIDRAMGKTNELYELAYKIFENDVNELKSEWFDTVSSTNKLVNL